VHDRRRLERLFTDHAPDVLAYALRRTDRATAEEIVAEEIVAEVFVVAWRRGDRVPEQDPVLWLYGVARRLLANERRAVRRRAALTTALGALARDRTAAPPPVAASSPLLTALAALRPADREVLMLTAWEGLDGTAAATVLGCTPQALHTRLHRARTRLAAELARSDDPPPIAPASRLTEASPS
jgi:RNA polymerase sigma factor (sigma-70 family)